MRFPKKPVTRFHRRSQEDPRLHQACALLEFGARAELANHSGHTPRWAAMRSGFSDIVEKLSCPVTQGQIERDADDEEWG